MWYQQVILEIQEKGGIVGYSGRKDFGNDGVWTWTMKDR